ncbi:DUF4342 domain-containing protein [Clostridium sp. 19966]|uniref:DUF4342 domain-containing protein n=1 Tax=Clostridium sp. 19966 TaxID=2768166 RepID=UPI0028DDEB3B|nr:DUF4342 domain-containing protein [Clostridium sp. 19966]MDT8716794.1 DUF4342 domain-containing protein [Clostridium sp. 19966]
MSTMLESIDELRKRTNVSYEDAKEALEKSNGDIVEAIVYLEKQNKIKNPQETTKDYSLWTSIKGIITKGNTTKFIIKKKEDIRLNISVTLAVILAIIAPHAAVLSILLAFITGHKIRFQGKENEYEKLNKSLTKISDSISSTGKDLVNYAVNSESIK